MNSVTYKEGGVLNSTHNVRLHLLRVFMEDLCDGNLGWSESSTEVLRCRLCRDAFLCFEPAVDLCSHPVEAARTLVDDTKATIAAAVKGWGQAAHTFVVANCILELLDLRDLGF